jgi:GNAT superfamily N-acetyltransferase
VEGARPATHADVPHLAELNRLALAEMQPLRGGTVFVAREARPEPLDDELAAALDDPAACVLVGTIDETPVGYAVCRVEDLRDTSRLGRLTDLFVEHDARGVGVGECLMDAALQWFADNGCAACDAYALPGDRNTKNFFEGSGFTARLLVMHHRIAP